MEKDIEHWYPPVDNGLVTYSPNYARFSVPIRKRAIRFRSDEKVKYGDQGEDDDDSRGKQGETGGRSWGSGGRKVRKVITGNE